MGSDHSKKGISGKAGLVGLAWAGVGARGLWGGVGGGSGIIIAEFGVKGLHFLHGERSRRHATLARA